MILVGVKADGITFIPDLHTLMSSRFIPHLFLGLPSAASRQVSVSKYLMHFFSPLF
jgi:hypothetical protein